MSHNKEVKFDFPASVPSTGGNYVRDKSGALSLLADEIAEQPAKAARKAKAIAAPPIAPTEEGS